MEQPEASSSAPLPQNVGVRHLVETLMQLEADLQRQVDAERARAEEAERSGAEAVAELTRLRQELEEIRRRTDEIESDRESTRTAMAQMAQAMRTYIKESAEAQTALLAVSRHLLGVGPIPDFDSAEDGAAAPAAQEEAAPDEADADTGDLDMSWAAPSGPPDLVVEGEDESTEDHRLIDLHNRLDMSRLDVVSRLAPSRALARRRSS